MELTDAIEIATDYIKECDLHDRRFMTPTPEELEALRVCVAAAQNCAEDA